MDDTLKIEELLREAGWLRALAASLVDPAQAEDLVQETWLATLRHPPRDEGSVRPWLARVVRNLAHNARRGRARHTALEELARDERPSVTASSAPENLVQEAETQRLLAEAVTRLPEPLGAVIVLRYFQGLDSGTAAARLGLPASTVRTRLQRALDALRADLDRRAPGGRESWAVLLAGLARPAREAALPAAPLAGAPPAGVLVASGIAVACLVGALGTFVWHAARGESKEEVALAGAEDLQFVDASSFGATPPARAASTSTPEREALGQPTAVDAATGAAAPVATAELSGVVLVDGRPPEWPLDLILSPTPPPPTKNGLRKLVPRIELALAPEQRGAFTFGPLPVTWTGDLRVEGHTFAGDKQTYAIDAPRPGLALDVRSGPATVGRVLLPDGRPASGVAGACLFQLGTGEWLQLDQTRTFQCRDDGRFRIPGAVGESASEWSVASLSIQGEAGYLQCDSPRFVPDEGFDFGELDLEPVRSLTFVVRDPDGHPIHPISARVVRTPFVDPASRLPPVGLSVAETEASGSGTLDFVPDREVSVWFGGLERYADRVVKVGGERAIEVVLEPVAALEVRLTGALVGRARLVLLSSERPAFLADESGWIDRPGERFASGSVHPSARRQPKLPGQRYEYEFAPGKGGHLSLAGLVPGVPLTLEVRDGKGNVLAAQSIAAGEREWAELEIRVP